MNESELCRCVTLVGKLDAMGVSLNLRRRGSFNAHLKTCQSRRVCMDLLGGDFVTAKAFMVAVKIEMIDSLMLYDRKSWSETWAALDLINAHGGEGNVPWLSPTRDAVRLLFDTLPRTATLLGRSSEIGHDLRTLLLDMELFVADQASIMARIDTLCMLCCT